MTAVMVVARAMVAGVVFSLVVMFLAIVVFVPVIIFFMTIVAGVVSFPIYVFFALEFFMPFFTFHHLMMNASFVIPGIGPVHVIMKPDIVIGTAAIAEVGHLRFSCQGP